MVFTQFQNLRNEYVFQIDKHAPYLEAMFYKITIFKMAGSKKKKCHSTEKLFGKKQAQIRTNQ